MAEADLMERLRPIITSFATAGELIGVEPLGAGLINATYRLTFALATGQQRYVLQRLNTAIFHDPLAVMSNIDQVTRHLRRKAQAAGRDPSREVLRVVPTRSGELGCDVTAGFFRLYEFIEHATCHQSATPPLLRRAGAAIGRFVCDLADFPAADLAVTIKDFHNTPVRWAYFWDQVAADPVDRVASAQREIDFVAARAADCRVVADLMAAGTIPLRVAHNDAKLNNVMMGDGSTGPDCLIDLDTVMPDTALWDFGDGIRSAANPVPEDEPDVAQVRLALPLFEAFAAGYVPAARLSRAEVDHLAWGARVITLEQAIRFLGDYIAGDVYYPVARVNQNLDRARNQIALVAEMERHFAAMRAIIDSFA